MENLDVELGRTWATVVAWIPSIAGFIVVAVGGVVLSAVARRVVAWLVMRTRLDVLAERVGVPRILYAVGIKASVPVVLGKLTWYAGLLVTLNALAGLLGLTGIADGVAALIAWLPSLLTGVVIAFAGVYAAEVVQGMVTRVAAARGDGETAELLGRGGYFLVLAVALTMAAEQVGLPTQLVNSILLLAVASVGFGVALAFALGAKGAFRNLVARHYLQRMYRPGDTLQLGEAGGELVRFGAVCAVLKTDDGEVVIPCSELLEGTVRLRRRQDG